MRIKRRWADGWKESTFPCSWKEKFQYGDFEILRPTQENVLKNELVSIKTREEPVRYIEFIDDKGTTVSFYNKSFGFV